jgi:pyruvate dehydrogenase (quinone)/pyruvate oxidase
MNKTAADILVDTLVDWEVNTIFGLPGDGINGIMEALRTRQEQIRFIQVRHEEAAAFMACAYAKFTGKLGVCLSTSGPGGVHLLNGLYDAKLDGAPVLAITGLQYHDLIGTYTQQDVELDRLFMDVAVYNARVMGPAHVENVMNLACRTALARNGVAHVTIPVDMQSQPVKDDKRSSRNVAHHVTDLQASNIALPTDDQFERAAAILNEGKKICILAGRGAASAGPLLETLADRLGAPVAKALLGKAVLADDNPYSVGGVGLLGTRPAQDALESCDTLLIVGSSFPYIEYYPEPGKARAVQIDADPARIGLRYPVEAALVGDTGRVLATLLPRLTPHDDRSFLTAAQDGMAEWRDLLTERATRTDMPMKPQVVVHHLDGLLRDNAIVAVDSGTITAWVARHVNLRDGMKFSCSGTLASMACSVPYAIAAAIAYPQRQVVAVVGDGGFTMLMGELATCVKYGLDIKIVIMKNDALGMIKWEQMGMLGNPEYGCELQTIDFAAAARAFGAHAVTISDPAHCQEQLTKAFAMTGPVVIEAVIDPHEPPMPPKASVGQAARMAKAIARGTPDGGRIMRTLGADVVRELT